MRSLFTKVSTKKALPHKEFTYKMIKSLMERAHRNFVPFIKSPPSSANTSPDQEQTKIVCTRNPRKKEIQFVQKRRGERQQISSTKRKRISIKNTANDITGRFSQRLHLP